MNLIDKLEEAILSLELMPHRGAKRHVGAYVNKGYRQLFINNFTIVYRIDEAKKQVIIVTVRYSPNEF
jgi:toxin ParE1/3/4